MSPPPIAIVVGVTWMLSAPSVPVRLTLSLPAPPSSWSLPGPPSSESLPGPPRRESEPPTAAPNESPDMKSVPSPPSRSSLPPPPVRLSLPDPPRIRSSPGALKKSSPFKASLPSPPNRSSPPGPPSSQIPAARRVASKMSSPSPPVIRRFSALVYESDSPPSMLSALAVARIVSAPLVPFRVAVSRPEPPLRESLPGPPSTESSPGPPATVSAPPVGTPNESPVRKSFPAPPSRESEAWPPFRLSLPSSPVIVSASPLPPTESAPSPPATVTAVATGNVSLVTLMKKMRFASGPPVTLIDVIAAQLAGPVSGFDKVDLHLIHRARNLNRVPSVARDGEDSGAHGRGDGAKRDRREPECSENKRC